MTSNLLTEKVKKKDLISFFFRLRSRDRGSKTSYLEHKQREEHRESVRRCEKKKIILMITNLLTKKLIKNGDFFMRD